jgi:RNA-directed DNA polymerase
MEPQEGKTPGTLSPERVSTRLKRIAELAQKAPRMAFTTLAHLIDIDLLHVAYRLTRKDGAPGVDGQTADSYERNLEANLQSLLDRFKSGTYQAPPVRRVYIPKADGSKTRPIGIPTFEDKVLQRAVAMILEAIYEQDFSSCNYGFRPGRSAHQALNALWMGLMDMHGGAVLELDIQKFFDTLDHGHLRDFLDQRVRDGVLRRTIDKWLAAGVLEDGRVTHPEFGSPQGGVVSPIISNVYLHEVLDRWFHDVVMPRLKGQAMLIRYADDAVIVFSREADAQRVLAVLPKRFGKYGLTLHPEKTRLVSFRQPKLYPSRRGGDEKRRPDTFDFLGFTHYWGKSLRKTWIVKRKTARTRLARALKSIGAWLKQNLHLPFDDQRVALTQKLRGHYGYYGITGNVRALSIFRDQMIRLWRKWLSRRSQRARLNWTQFSSMLNRVPIPSAYVAHSVLPNVANA